MRCLVALCLCPLGALAQGASIADLTRPHSTVDLTALWLSDANAASARDTGLVRAGGHLVLGADLRGAGFSYGNPADDRVRWRLLVRDLGIDTREVRAEYGRQGRYRFTATHEAIPRHARDGYHTLFPSGGGALPAGFTRAGDTSGMAGLAQHLARADLSTLRERTAFTLRHAPARDWEWTAGWKLETVRGQRARGLEVGNNGGNPRNLSLPEEIDQRTHEWQLGLAWSDVDSRVAVNASTTLFDNRVPRIAWQNAYSSAPWTGGATGLPAGFPLDQAQAGVAPGSRHHQLSIQAAHDLSASARATFTAILGRATQDEAFLPYTVNAALLSTPLPRASLDGRVDTLFAAARYSARPWRRAMLHASLTVDDRDARTPLAEYLYVGGDSQRQSAPGADNDRTRTSLPRSRRQVVARMELEQRLAASSLVASLRHEDLARTHAEVAKTREDGATLEWKGRAGDVDWRVSEAWFTRRGREYRFNGPYLESLTSTAFIAGLIAANQCGVPLECVRVTPMQTKYFLADRDRMRTRAVLGWHPGAAWSVEARVDWHRDRYPHSPQGVQRGDSDAAALDAHWMPVEGIALNAFLHRDRQRVDERTRQGSASNTMWWNRQEERTVTAGLAASREGLLGGRLGLDASALVVRARTPIATTVGDGVPATQSPAAALPDLRSNSMELRLGARLALARESSVHLQYRFRRLSSADWAYEQVAAATLANAIGTLEQSPRFRQHALAVTWQLAFR